MTFEDCLVAVIGEDDRKFESLCEWIVKKCPGGEPHFVHAPIEANFTLTWNDLYEALAKSTRDYVIVVRESKLGEVDFESVLNTFKSSRALLSSPLLVRYAGNVRLDESERFELTMEVVVAKRVDLFVMIEKQSKQRAIDLQRRNRK